MRDRGYSVYQRKGRPVWYIEYKSVITLDWVCEATPFRKDDPAGRRRAVHLAEQKAASFQKLGGLTRAEAFNTWVPQFLAGRYANSPRTLPFYQLGWTFVSAFLNERKVIAPAQLTYNHAIEFVAWRTAQKRHCGKFIGKNTALCNLRCLSLVMQEAVRRGYVLSNCLLRMGIRKDLAKEKVELLPSEVALIRSAVKVREAHLPAAERWMTNSFEIAYYQGCRLTETQVSLDRINEAKGEITFHTKGKRIHPTALHPALLPLLKELRGVGAKWTCVLPRMAAKEWWALRQELKLGHTTFHSLRVGVVTQLARSGVSEQQAMRFVGHSSRLVHAVYQKLKVEDLGACLSALSARPSIAATAQSPDVPASTSEASTDSLPSAQ